MLAKILDKYQHDPIMLATLAARWRRRAYRDQPEDAWKFGMAWAYAYDAASFPDRRSFACNAIENLRLLP